ncbi:hypothetical protein D3C87_1640280 [compost metagenome]
MAGAVVVALDRQFPRGELAQPHDAAADLGARVGMRLALLARQQAHESVCIGLQAIGHVAQRRLALRDGAFAPGSERGAGSGNRGVQLVQRRIGRGRDARFGGGIEHVERLRGSLPAAVQRHCVIAIQIQGHD